MANFVESDLSQLFLLPVDLCKRLARVDDYSSLARAATLRAADIGWMLPNLTHGRPFVCLLGVPK